MFSKLCETAKGLFAQLSPSQAIRQSASEKDQVLPIPSKDLPIVGPLRKQQNQCLPAA